MWGLLCCLLTAHYCSQIWPYIYIITTPHHTTPHHTTIRHSKHSKQRPNQMSRLDCGNAPAIENVIELTGSFLDNWGDWKWAVSDRYNEHPGKISSRDCSIIWMMTGGLSSSSSSSSSSPSWHAIVVHFILSWSDNETIRWRPFFCQCQPLHCSTGDILQVSSPALIGSHYITGNN